MSKALNGTLQKVTLNLYEEDVALAKVLYPRGSVGGWSLIVREVLHAFMEAKRKKMTGDLEDDRPILTTTDGTTFSTGPGEPSENPR